MTTQVTRKKFPVQKKALVIGGGLAGAAAACSIATGGVPVVLVEEAAHLPILDTHDTWPAASHQGKARDANRPPDLHASSSVSELAVSLGERLRAHPQIEVRTSAVLSSVSGHVGDFLVTLDQTTAPSQPSLKEKSSEPANQREEAGVSTGAGRQELRVGAIIVAVDSAKSPAQTFANIHNGKNTLTLSEFNQIFKPSAVHRHEMLSIGGKVPKSIAFLLAPLPLSSRDSTARVLQTSVLLRHKIGCEVSVFFSSLQVAGNGLAERYRQARRAGVLFLPYAQPPVIEVSDADVCVRHEDIFTPDSEAPAKWRFDGLVLDEIAAPSPGLAQIAAALGVRADSADFTGPVNPTLLPVNSSRKGIFIIGGSRGDTSVEDSMIEAAAASAEVLSILSGQELEAEVRAVVDPAKCALCLTCVRVCPHVAIDYAQCPEYNRSAARICDAACMGCGICASECPAQAIEMTGMPPEDAPGEVLVLCCRRSAYMAHAAVLARHTPVPAHVRIREIPCAGKVSVEDMLGAFQSGFGKVLVLGCHQDACRSLYGNTAAQKRIDFVKKFLRKLGIPGERIAFARLSASQVGLFQELAFGVRR